ncbi:MAG: response regulator, partial [Archangium sp.]
DAADLLAEALAERGHLVRVAHDGLRALEIAREFAPEIALVDIGLPVIDGHEVGRRLRLLPGLKGVKLVAVSGYGQEADQTQSKRAGFDAHLVKPIGLEQIEREIERLCRQ